MKLTFKCCFVALTLASSSALACMGDGTSFGIDFKDGETRGELVAVLKNSKSGNSHEVYDDDGLVSMTLVVARVNSLTGKGPIDATKQSELINFMRSRITQFRNTSMKAIPANLQKDVAEKLNAMEEAYSASAKADGGKMIGSYMDFIGLLRQNNIQPMAKMKASGAGAFSSPTLLSNIEMPSLMRTRSAGCNVGVDSFQTAVRRNATPPVKAASGAGGRL